MRAGRFRRGRVAAFVTGLLAVLTVSVFGSSAAQASLTFVNRTTADGLGANGVRTIFVDGQNVYVGTNSGLSISTDGGVTFTNRTTAAGLGDNTIDGIWASGTTVYAATGSGLSVSTDGGQTFVNNNLGGGMNAAVKAASQVGQNLYVATVAGLNVSTDGGQSFTLLRSDAFGGSASDAFIPDVQAVGSTVYVAVYYLNNFAISGGIFKSTDSGVSFSATGAPSGNWVSVFVDGSNVYATDSSNQLFVSTDGGATFAQWSLPGVAVSNVWASGVNVYLSTDGGLMSSTDGGQSFTTYTTSDGLGADQVYGGVSSNGTAVFAGTQGGLSIGTSPTPTVTAVSPTSGPEAGGTLITITGTNFAAGATVTVGGAACTGVTVVSTTSITCTTAVGTAGTASVVVTSNGLSNAANTLFTYNAPPPPPPPPAAPVTTAPPTTAPPATLPNVPALINTDNQSTLTQSPGGATAIVNGEVVAVEVEAPADLPAAQKDPEDRSPAEVAALQDAAESLIDELNDVAGGNSGLSVVPSPTGASITGLMNVPVPIENTVIVKTDDQSTVFAALNQDGSVTEVQPGAQIEVLGNGQVGVAAFGLTPGETVEFVLMSTPTLLGRFEVDAQGGIKAQAQLPSSVGTGSHTLVVASPTVKASLGLKIGTPAAPMLPVTGGDAGDLAPVMLLLAVGAVLVIVSRRRITLVP